MIVEDYDEAIRFFVDTLGFDLVDDSPSTANDGRPKRWVVVRPPGAGTGLLLAQAHGDRQGAVVGEQWAGRVGLFLRVDDFEVAYRRMVDRGVEFVTEPRHESYGTVAVFVDVAGNRWDLLGPAPAEPIPAEPVAVSGAGEWAAAGPPVLRRERPDDRAASRAVQVAAFGRGQDGPETGVGAGEPVEAGLLDALRGDGWIPELSWVAEIDGGVVGHNICTRGHVGDVPCVGLGPIGVEPRWQGRGVGSALMWAVIGAADARGEPLIALLGNPDYYRRFGFVASTELGVQPPDDRWGRFFQVRSLSAWTPSVTGRFRYAQPFDDLE